MTFSVAHAKAFRDGAVYVLPVAASVVVFIVAVVQSNMAMFAIAAGLLGVPGISTAAQGMGSVSVTSTQHGDAS